MSSPSESTGSTLITGSLTSLASGTKIGCGGAREGEARSSGRSGDVLGLGLGLLALGILMREIFLRQLMCYTKCKVKKIEIRIESDLVYSAIAVLFEEGEQSERAAARLPRPTRCAAGAGAWWRMRRVSAKAAPAQPSTLCTFSNRRVQGVSVHDLRGRFPVRLLPVFSSTDFPSVLLVRAGLIRPAGGICRGLRYIWLCCLVVITYCGNNLQ